MFCAIFAVQKSWGELILLGRAGRAWMFFSVEVRGARFLFAAGSDVSFFLLRSVFFLLLPGFGKGKMAQVRSQATSKFIRLRKLLSDVDISSCLHPPS